MLPALWPGEKVWVEQTNVDELQNGDVIVFVRDHQLVVHRVVGIAKSTNRTALTTRGDAQLEDDVPVEPRDVVGVVRAVRRFGAARPLSGRPSLAAGILSRLVRRSEMVRFLLAGIHSRWVNGTIGRRRPSTASGVSQ